MSDNATPAPQSLNLRVGDKAPDFTLPMFPEGEFTLSDLAGKRTVVLYFYPMDDTPGCTAQACSFRDLHEEFGKYNATILGVSADSLESHKAFTEKYSLPFSLLVDEESKLRHLFGMPNPDMELRARVTYIIDKHGVVRHIVNVGEEKVDVEVHIQESLDWAKKLAAEDHAGGAG
jgi:peroxiredoxin Q/BCP